MSAMVATLLVNAAWQIPVLAAIAFALTRWPSLSAAERHRVWGITLLLCFLTPLLNGQESSLQMVRSRQDTVNLSSSSGSSAAKPPSQRFAVIVSKEVTSALVFVYAAFVLLGILRLARSLRGVTALRRHAAETALPRELRGVESRCRGALGVAEGRLLSSARVTSPVTCGFFDPVILVPSALTRNSSRELWTAVLGHELAHIRRRDYAWHIVFECVMLFVGIHPVARWMKKRLERTREEACDEIVARELVNPRRYARSLVEAASLFSQPKTGYSLGVLGPASLEERIMALIDLETSRERSGAPLLAIWVGATLVVSALALSSFSLALAAPTPPTQEPTQSNAEVTGFEQQDAEAPDQRESYRVAGRRDPFLGPESRATEGPGGLWGFDVDTVRLHGIVKTPAGFTAMLVGPDEKTYFVREGQRFYNGVLASIDEGAVVIQLQDEDPISTLARRDVELRLHQP